MSEPEHGMWVRLKPMEEVIGEEGCELYRALCANLCITPPETKNAVFAGELYRRIFGVYPGDDPKWDAALTKACNARGITL